MSVDNNFTKISQILDPENTANNSQLIPDKYLKNINLKKYNCYNDLCLSEIDSYNYKLKTNSYYYIIKTGDKLLIKNIIDNSITGSLQRKNIISYKINDYSTSHSIIYLFLKVGIVEFLLIDNTTGELIETSKQHKLRDNYELVKTVNRNIFYLFENKIIHIKFDIFYIDDKINYEIYENNVTINYSEVQNYKVNNAFLFIFVLYKYTNDKKNQQVISVYSKEALLLNNINITATDNRYICNFKLASNNKNKKFVDYCKLENIDLNYCIYIVLLYNTFELEILDLNNKDKNSSHQIIRCLSLNQVDIPVINNTNNNYLFNLDANNNYKIVVNLECSIIIVYNKIENLIFFVDLKENDIYCNKIFNGLLNFIVKITSNNQYLFYFINSEKNIIYYVVNENELDLAVVTDNIVQPLSEKVINSEEINNKNNIPNDKLNIPAIENNKITIKSKSDIQNLLKINESLIKNEPITTTENNPTAPVNNNNNINNKETTTEKSTTEEYTEIPENFKTIVESCLSKFSENIKSNVPISQDISSPIITSKINSLFNDINSNIKKIIFDNFSATTEEICLPLLEKYLLQIIEKVSINLDKGLKYYNEKVNAESKRSDIIKENFNDVLSEIIKCIEVISQNVNKYINETLLEKIEAVKKNNDTIIDKLNLIIESQNNINNDLKLLNTKVDNLQVDFKNFIELNYNDLGMADINEEIADLKLC